MMPNFLANDHVLVLRTNKLQKGSVIVFEYTGKFLIKRVKKINAGAVIAVSDNKKLAKREYMVPLNKIVGRVFLKY